MSVEVKTPTKTQFEHAEFPCGDNKPRIPTLTVTGSGGPPPAARPVFQRQTSENIGNRYSRKRRFSERAGGAEGGRERYIGAPGFKKSRFGRMGNRSNSGGQEKIVLPTKFFLGGNINDPLNLNSLSDEAINKALNENTPKSSPLAIPRHRQEVHVIIPPNIQDPLGLTSGDDLLLLSPKSAGKKRQRKNKHKKKNQGDKSDANDASDMSNLSALMDSKDYTKPMHIDVTSDSEITYQQNPAVTDATFNQSDPLLSPTEPGNNTSSSSGPQTKQSEPGKTLNEPQLMSPRGRRRKRTTSECKSDSSQCLRTSVDSDKSAKSDKTSPHRPKYVKRQYSHSSSISQPTTPPAVRVRPRQGNRSRKHGKQFIYGNYNRYYGYRNPDGSEKDDRLQNFQRKWFEGKDVLDIGCNVGHVTLNIAKEFGPRQVVGMDIDGSLIAAAKRNIRHYLTTKVTDTKKYPSSMVASFGPIAAPPIGDNEEVAFPNNVMFLTGNYVLESEELVDMTREEYDVILALSITKWVHLNWGDAGLKRMFRRMYKQLRPGGKLILEPQLWPSYKKRKKLTEAHSMNYTQIRLKPEQFREYLLREIGFSKCEGLEVPFNKAKGFQRPLLIFSKSDTTQPTSRVTTPGRSDTCSWGATPRFHVGWSGTASPAMCESHSNPATPAMPGFIDSPRCQEKYIAKTDALDAVTEESFVVNSPIGESTPLGRRPRSLSAPCLLETTHCGISDKMQYTVPKLSDSLLEESLEDGENRAEGLGATDRGDYKDMEVTTSTTEKQKDVEAIQTGACQSLRHSTNEQFTDNSLPTDSVIAGPTEVHINDRLTHSEQGKSLSEDKD